VRKHCSNPRCFKEKNYEAKFSTNLILKKIDKDNFEKKNTKTKKNKKKKEGHYFNSLYFLSFYIEKN
jgi:hypothetical protein